jgi:hypothetical protein
MGSPERLRFNWFEIRLLPIQSIFAQKIVEISQFLCDN